MNEQVNKVNEWGEKALSSIIDYAPKILLALVILWIGTTLIRMLARLLGEVLDRRGVELIKNRQPRQRWVIGRISRRLHHHHRRRHAVRAAARRPQSGQREDRGRQIG